MLLVYGNDAIMKYKCNVHFVFLALDHRCLKTSIEYIVGLYNDLMFRLIQIVEENVQTKAIWFLLSMYLILQV
jgi:hypothetical protein